MRQVGRRPLSTSECGFTTIELMAVLVVLVVMSGLIVVSMGPALRDARSRSGCRVVLSALNYARSHAIANRVATRVMFEAEKNGVCVYTIEEDSSGVLTMTPLTTTSGRFHKLPKGVEITQVVKPGVVEEERGVTFTQLGRSEYAAISIIDERGKEWIITVDAVTGRCVLGVGEEK